MTVHVDSLFLFHDSSLLQKSHCLQGNPYLFNRPTFRFNLK